MATTVLLNEVDVELEAVEKKLLGLFAATITSGRIPMRRKTTEVGADDESGTEEEEEMLDEAGRERRLQTKMVKKREAERRKEQAKNTVTSFMSSDQRGKFVALAQGRQKETKRAKLLMRSWDDQFLMASSEIVDEMGMRRSSERKLLSKKNLGGGGGFEGEISAMPSEEDNIISVMAETMFVDNDIYPPLCAAAAFASSSSDEDENDEDHTSTDMITDSDGGDGCSAIGNGRKPRTGSLLQKVKNLSFGSNKGDSPSSPSSPKSTSFSSRRQQQQLETSSMVKGLASLGRASSPMTTSSSSGKRGYSVKDPTSSSFAQDGDLLRKSRIAVKEAASSRRDLQIIMGSHRAEGGGGGVLISPRCAGYNPSDSPRRSGGHTATSPSSSYQAAAGGGGGEASRVGTAHNSSMASATATTPVGPPPENDSMLDVDVPHGSFDVSFTKQQKILQQQQQQQHNNPLRSYSRSGVSPPTPNYSITSEGEDFSILASEKVSLAPWKPPAVAIEADSKGELPNGRHRIRLLTRTVMEKPDKGFKNKDEAIKEQGEFCRGCMKGLRPGISAKRLGRSWDTAKFCYYTGFYYCTDCHPANRFTVVPSRVLHSWDFDMYPVCTEALDFLEMQYDEPILCVSAVNPNLYESLSVLRAARHVRLQLTILHQIGAHCPVFRAQFYSLKRKKAPSLSLESAIRRQMEIAAGTHNEIPPSSDSQGQAVGAASPTSPTATTTFIPNRRRYLIEDTEFWSLSDLSCFHAIQPSMNEPPTTGAAKAQDNKQSQLKNKGQDDEDDEDDEEGDGPLDSSSRFASSSNFAKKKKEGNRKRLTAATVAQHCEVLSYLIKVREQMVRHCVEECNTPLFTSRTHTQQSAGYATPRISRAQQAPMSSRGARGDMMVTGGGNLMNDSIISPQEMRQQTYAAATCCFDRCATVCPLCRKSRSRVFAFDVNSAHCCGRCGTAYHMLCWQAYGDKHTVGCVICSYKPKKRTS